MVVCMENNKMIKNNNTRIKSVLHTHNYKPTFALPHINQFPLFIILSECNDI